MESHASQEEQIFRLSQLLDITTGPLPTLIFPVLETLLGLRKLRTVYHRLPPHTPREFFSIYLEALRVTLDCPPLERAQIPAIGPCVLVANHPFGMIEGIALGAILAKVRADFKFLGNYLLDQVPDLRPHNIAVDPFGGATAMQRNYAPLRATMQWLRDGGALAVFPSGEVAHYIRGQGVTDPPWQENLARIIRRAHAPVIPVYFSGANSLRFQLLGMLHPRVRTVLLPSELLNKAGKTLRIHIGAPLTPAELTAVATDTEMMKHLRAQTYALGTIPAPTTTALLDDPAAGEGRRQPATDEPMEPVAPAEPVTTLTSEMAALPAEAMLCESGEFQVYLAASAQIPHMLYEIGRQREIAFRLVGEGSRTALDLDAFDQTYLHLFLWNTDKQEVAGAYRLGQADVIVRQSGVAGLYTSTLFKYDASLITRFDAVLELGRSFVRAEYQRSFSALYLLWRGIGQFIGRNPQYRYLFGPVSISDEYTSMSQQLLAAFLTANHLWTDLTECIAPHHPMCIDNGAQSVEEIASIDELSKQISALESGERGIPVLLRHYLRLGGRLLGFNIDPQFSNAIDGLILVDLLQTPPKLLEKYIGAECMDRLVRYHQTSNDSDLACADR